MAGVVLYPMAMAKEKLTGRVAIVTGASRGIGRATALELARQGADVMVHYHRRAAEAQAVAQKIREMGRRSRVVQADLRYYEGCQHVVQATLEAFGRVDILVNNAGVSEHRDFFEITPEEWDNMIRANLSHVFFMSQLAARDMAQRGFGRIIHIGSLRARIGSAHGAHYAAAKSGILGLARSMALILGPLGITVNTVAPGYTRTDMTRRTLEEREDEIRAQIPVRRVSEPEDIARVVAFLAWPENQTINGAIIDVNGGLYLPA